jgi:hypothetical protein
VHPVVAAQPREGSPHVIERRVPHELCEVSDERGHGRVDLSLGTHPLPASHEYVLCVNGPRIDSVCFCAAARAGAGSGARFRVASRALVRYAFHMRKARVTIALAAAGTLAAVVIAQACQEQCENNLQFCVAACVDISSDVDNCGSCSAFCSFAEACSESTCHLLPFGDAGADAADAAEAMDAADGGSFTVAKECAECARLVLFPEGATCTAALVACKADPDCDTWSLCASACFTTTFSADCFNACAGTYADGGDPTLLAPVVACVCVQCPDLCVPMCPLTLEALSPGEPGANVVSTVTGPSYPPLPSKP